MKNNKTEFILVDKKNENNDVTSLFFKQTDNNKFKFIPGQYVDIKLQSILGHGKSYTISSDPSDESVRLTIKRKGVISSAIIDMQVDDSIIFDGPYGNFYPDDTVNDIVMIAGGIGVAPFYSIIKNQSLMDSDKKIKLIYSNKTKSDIIFFDGLNELAKNNNNLEIIYCLTQEKSVDAVIGENRRIDKGMLKSCVMQDTDRCYFICGSIGFVDSIWRTLKVLGVLEEKIFTEAFY
jgi:ferredoxin-NADP reductase